MVSKASKTKNEASPSVDEFKLAVIGGGGVGKSAFTIQFIQNTFICEYDPTIEDSYRKQTKIDDKVCFLEILDTAGQEEYKALRDQYMRQVDGFACVYSITERKSLIELEEFVTQIHRVKDVDYFPMVLIGNKCDLESERSVKQFEALQFAKNTMKITNEEWVIEGSAKKRKNVDEAFTALVRAVRKFNETKEPIKVPKKACLLL